MSISTIAAKAEGRSPLDERESLASWMQENMLKEHRGVLRFGFQRLIVTEHCFVGKAFYSAIQNGDITTILLGHSVPVILRPVEDHFEYIGELYPDG
jgi:hypothetical protein